MTHEQNPQCKMVHDDYLQHKKESEKHRDDISKHSQQILTLEQARVYQMETIDDIKKDINVIKTSISTLSGDVKVWVLGGLVGAIVVFSVPTISLFYDAGQKTRQIEINTKRLEQIEGKRNAYN